MNDESELLQSVQSVDDATAEEQSRRTSDDIKVSQWCARRRREERGERRGEIMQMGRGKRGLPDRTGPDQYEARSGAILIEERFPLIGEHFPSGVATSKPSPSRGDAKKGVGWVP